jgi:hypothetical protein
MTYSKNKLLKISKTSVSFMIINVVDIKKDINPLGVKFATNTQYLYK